MYYDNLKWTERQRLIHLPLCCQIPSFALIHSDTNAGNPYPLIRVITQYRINKRIRVRKHIPSVILHVHRIASFLLYNEKTKIIA